MKAPTWSTVAIGVGAGFLTGAIGVAVLMQLPRGNAASPGETRRSESRLSETRTAQPVQAVKASRLASTDVSRPPADTSAAPRIGLEPIADLKKRHLEVPVRGIERGALTDSFSQARSEGRHEAMDILAPRNTPVLAVEDGTIAKLFQSKAGGTTIYQFDPNSTYAYYYAHLERYADHIREGLQVRRGDVLGYVGTSGNAPKNTPHLHFAILKLGEDKKWWQGTAIDPFDVLR
jgi:murein DD-endopeptidase MepM/ murein hydrolase activator NlpD